jgi:isopentenyl diphosphate isomerase/L-lactate dehydrogenase-like FMN-dependent dehydrogenase
VPVPVPCKALVLKKNVSTTVNLPGQTLDNPIIMCPVGFQKLFHPDGEIGSAKASVKKKYQLIVSSVSNYSVNEIAE